jgi:gliding motility-associated protein GldM
MNVFYRGVDNPVEISVPGVPASKITATMTNGNLRPTEPGKFIANPSVDQGEAVVTVVAEVDGQRKNMGERRFRLRRVPDPVAKVGGKSGGRMAKNELLLQTGVIAELEDFLFDMKFTVRGFKVTVISGGAGGFLKDAVSTSARFTEEQKQLIGSSSLNNRIIFEDITASGEDGIIRSLPPITFTIQ